MIGVNAALIVECFSLFSQTATNVDAAFLTMSKELIAAREKAAAGAGNGAKGRTNLQLKPAKAKDTKCCA